MTSNDAECDGDGRVLGSPKWVLGDRNGRLAILESEVRDGTVLHVP